MATINDKFTKAADGTGTYPAVASVTQPRETQGDTLTCDDLSGWPTDTAVHFTTFRVLADGKIDTSVQTAYKGIVVGNTITQITRVAGAEDSGHLVGDKVEVNPTVGWVADLVEGILKSHNQDGTLKNDIIQTRNIQDGAVTGDKIAGSTVKSSNIDWDTVGNNSSYFRIGKIQICFGKVNVTFSNNNESSATVNLPVAYGGTDYKVIACPEDIADWHAEGCVVQINSSSRFTIMGHLAVGTSNLTMPVSWMSIGLVS